MECYDCETLLQVGIDAFQWLVRADESIRRAVFSARLDYEAEQVQSAMELLLKAWLEPVPRVNQVISRQLDRGFALDNLDEFRECESQVRSIVDSLQEQVLHDGLAAMRDSAAQEHLAGQTMEFDLE